MFRVLFPMLCGSGRERFSLRVSKGNLTISSKEQQRSKTAIKTIICLLHLRFMCACRLDCHTTTDKGVRLWQTGDIPCRTHLWQFSAAIVDLSEVSRVRSVHPGATRHLARTVRNRTHHKRFWRPPRRLGTGARVCVALSQVPRRLICARTGAAATWPRPPVRLPKEEKEERSYAELNEPPHTYCLTL